MSGHSKKEKALQDNPDARLDLERWGAETLRKLSKKELENAAQEIWAVLQTDKKEMALSYYVPASDDVLGVHASTARVRFVGGGNGSSKTEGSLVECVIAATGIVPRYLKERIPDWRKKLRGPTSGRVVCQSITNTLEPIILPKLRWNCWTGIDEPGGERGHWGWIPKMCLIDGDWQKSWNSKTRMLRLLYRNPDNIDEVVGESRIQFQSYDVDAADQESGDLHWVLLDEPPSEAIYNANEARTMRVGGWIMLAMTWPDDPSISVDWIFDRVYDRGIPGPNKFPDYECFRLRTSKNRYISQERVEMQRKAWDSKTASARLEGQPIRFSNRVHELFTDVDETWCFPCGERQPLTDEGRCCKCGSEDTCTYNHVQDFVHRGSWPVVSMLDPHPRKPHYLLWVTVTPSGDWWVIADLEVKGDPSDVRVSCEDLEAELGLRVVRRLIDPNMAGSPSGAVRDRTWLDEFDAAGIYFEPADKSETGRAAIDHMLRPDPDMRAPRVVAHPRCTTFVYQMKRFMWDDWRSGADKSQKQRVKEKYDDAPACLRYFANGGFEFDSLTRGAQVIRAQSVRSYGSREMRA